MRSKGTLEALRTVEEPVWNREKGELTILGRRHAAVDIQLFCDFLDLLVGAKVGEVMMKNLQSRLGKEDGAWLKKVHPQASLGELAKIACERDRMAGVGTTKVTLLGPGPDSVALMVSNPAVKGNKGAAKAFLFAWWAGVISSFVGSDFEYTNVVYDESENTIRCEIVPRRTA